ncbi:MAG: poly(R)-hydroxyalkanoic acid synthase subunit PhaE [Gammaproteobacteria bacterium]
MKDKMKFPFWNTDWVNSVGMNSQPDWFQNQKQYMDAWNSFQQFMPNSSSAIHPMYEAMSSWWKSAAPSLSGQNQDFYNKMMQQGQAFYFMGEQFSKILEGMSEVKEHSEEWQKVLNDHFESMKSILEQSQTMQGAFPTLPFLQADFQKDYLKVIEILSAADKYSSIPGVGTNRESLQQIQEGVRLMGEYQQISHEFNILMNKVGVEALEVMRLMIIEMAERGEEINSLKELYNLWVDCNEKAYAEYVYTDEYSELYGRLSNALMAVKQHYGKVIDQMLSRLNLPTKNGVNTMLKRQQELKRAQMKSAEKLRVLESEVIKLREMLAEQDKSAAVGRKKQSRVSKNTSQDKKSRKTAKKTSRKKANRKATSKKTAGEKTIVIEI